MVAKVIGKVDGSEVIYEKGEEDKWTVTVPSDLDGMYVVEVTAYDEAGNSAYCTKMLLIVDPATLCVSLVPYEYIVEVVQDDYMIDVVYPNHGRCCCE